MFKGFHVTRRTRKDNNGKGVKYDRTLKPVDGADGCKASGKNECVDLFVREIELPETVDDIAAMCTDPNWLEPAETVTYGFNTRDDASQDNDKEYKQKNTPRIVALLVNAIKLERNAKTNAEVAPKGMVKKNREEAMKHWALADQAGFVAMVVACNGDEKQRNAKLDEYFAEHLAE